MCGIVGFIYKKEQDLTPVAQALRHIEYRGYDSAGVAWVDNGKISFHKEEGEHATKQNEKHIIDNSIRSTASIGHTRWATHGKATVENAHPHLASDSSFALVHNGEIGNYEDLKNDYDINYENDTRVVVHVLENEIRKAKESDESIEDVVIKVCKTLTGNNNFIFLSKNNFFIAIRQSDQALYIGEDEHGKYVVSDQLAFPKTVTHIREIPKGVYITSDTILDDSFVVARGRIEAEFPPIYPEEGKATEGEIDEIPYVLTRLSNKDQKKELEKAGAYITEAQRVILFGCGTSFYAASLVASYLREKRNIWCEVLDASEGLIDQQEGDIYIAFSQSGTTADVLKHIPRINGLYPLIVITNRVYSPLGSIADVTLDVCAGPEIAVAATKSFVGMISVGYTLAENKNIFEIDIDTVIEENKISFEIENYAKSIIKTKHCIILGEGNDFFLAQEAALKLKEIGYIWCLCEKTGGIKHGPLALVENDVPVILVSSSSDLSDKYEHASTQIVARGGVLLPVIVNLHSKENSLLVRHVIMSIYVYKLALFVSYIQNINPDKPRNLAKSVTVE